MSMVRKPFWRRIRLLYIDAVLLACLLVVVVMHRHEMRWGSREISRYLQNEITSPSERHMYLRGRDLVRRDMPEAALPWLEEAARIDPTSKAVVYLAEAHYKLNRYPQALKYFQRYTQLNPTDLKAHLRIAEIESKSGNPAGARLALLRGCDFFRANLPLFESQQDGSVDAKYNDKARKTYQMYLDNLESMEKALHKLQHD